MKKELQVKLFSKYPKIFKQKDLPMTKTCMCWGIECGDGWFNLIDKLCNLLQFDTDNNKEPQIETTQVKEKYGGLRFYTRGETDSQSGMIRLAEHLSNYICEICGSMENVTRDKEGWINTLCGKCRKLKNGGSK